MKGQSLNQSAAETHGAVMGLALPQNVAATCRGRNVSGGVRVLAYVRAHAHICTSETNSHRSKTLCVCLCVFKPSDVGVSLCVCMGLRTDVYIFIFIVFTNKFP